MNTNNADCLLIHVPKLLEYDHFMGWHSRVNFIAIGVYSICEQLEKEGLKTQIINIGVEKLLNPKFSIVDYVKKSGAKFIAFSLHWHPQSYDTIEVARALKKAIPDLFITLGGYTSSYYAEEILTNFPFIDAVIRGEGEIPIAELAKKVKLGDFVFDELPNISWRKDSVIINNPITFVADDEDLNQWSFSSLDKVLHYETFIKLPYYISWNKPAEEVLAKSLYPTIFGLCLGRGCPGNCTWCGGGYKITKKLTTRSKISWKKPEKVAENIFTLKEKYNIHNFHIGYDPIPNKRSNMLELLEILGAYKEKITVTYECFGLPDLEFLDSFKKNLAPDSSLIISPEFHSEEMRKKHRSFFYTNKELEDVLTLLDEKEIKSELYFTCGLPGETIKSVEETIEYKDSLKNKYKMVQASILMPIEIEPGSPWYEDPDKYGIKVARRSFMDFYKINSSKEKKLGYETANFKEKDIKTIREKNENKSLSEFVKLRAKRFVRMTKNYLQGKHISLADIRKHD